MYCGNVQTNRRTNASATPARPKKLGSLERVDPRKIWGREALDFTPWGAETENLRLLSNAIGIDLRLHAQEQRVGPFRADLVCHDDTGEVVLIENQLEKSDHGHLGQVVTYAAGLGTKAVVWVATSFCDEHRRALEWLNELGDGRIRFLAVQFELLSVSGSDPAPRF